MAGGGEELIRPTLERMSFTCAVLNDNEGSERTWQSGNVQTPERTNGGMHPTPPRSTTPSKRSSAVVL